MIWHAEISSLPFREAAVPAKQTAVAERAGRSNIAVEEISEGMVMNNASTANFGKVEGVDGVNSEANIVRGVDPKTLSRSHEISGRSSSNRVNDIADDMRQSGYNGPPIDVVEHNGQYYIIDGHHRAAAARRTGTEVDIRIVDDVVSHPSSYKSIEELVRDAQLLGPDRLTHPNRYRK